MTDENFLKQVGKKIAESRKIKGYSQTDLGAIIDMEKSNLSAIENGRQNPSSLTLKKIADALDCNVKDFF
jgi:transcriptional regulator with XRE-family HTH domain